MTYHALTEAKRCLLEPTGLNEAQLFLALESMLSGGADYADLYFQNAYSESLSLEDGLVKQGAFGVDQGVGIRALSGAGSALAFSDDLTLGSLTGAVDVVRTVIKRGAGKPVDLRSNPFNSPPPLAYYSSENPILLLETSRKVELLQKIDQLARARDPRVQQVQASFRASYETILILGSDGRLAADLRPLVSLSLNIVVQSQGRLGTAQGGGGGRHSYAHYTDEVLRQYVQRAVDSALVQLDAVDAPAGVMSVVCAAGWPAVLLHEAVGHGLEGDFVRKGESVFSGRLGQRVAAQGVTIVDDGTLPGCRGSLTIDDEGNPTACTTLIEDGILTGFMHDDRSARMMQVPPTGNGRRQSYAHETLPRMTNTYMVNGRHEPEEIIRSIKKGIYTVNFSGGEVDITSGRFTFAATEAYLIEDGRITAPIKGATLIGNGPESLKRISMIGNNLALDPGFASCGKSGQTVEVGVGQPTIRIDEMTVGGTA